MSTTIIDNISAIQIQSPVDIIIHQIRNLIVSGQLKPGDRLPSERILSERFQTGRSYVREAILKLQFYGLLKTNPQSGTYVAGLSINIIDSMIGDLINFSKDDFYALIEARYHLELNAVQLAAQRRSEEDLKILKDTMLTFEIKTNNNQSSVEEDMLFHTKIAQASQNTVLSSMLLHLIPDLVKHITEKKVCGENQVFDAIDQHRAIYEAIEKQDANLAEEAMKIHLNAIWELSQRELKNRQII
ncbi:FadR family transcriptional regulator [Parapedobacter sp. SGR-10]|uniref:FadR/GntR family transcriptional regulator n=1 Tax=Parapedobacter sp. SGR-10 TaxID=2710879 RepID=UPI0013D141A8|nr:FadR/GntR family transcriptional regulator [Parapedobacter sp. SGR-10]NGF55601.1 FadR family transcriptional regulator [Parapedobacter sp. SGR-10]